MEQGVGYDGREMHRCGSKGGEDQEEKAGLILALKGALILL